MKKINYLLLTLFMLLALSCEQEYKKEYSWAYPLSGDWMLKEYVDGVASGSPFEIKIYNSSFGKDSIWIDDYGTGVASASQYGNYWTMKFKAKADMTSKTFQTGLSTSVIPGYGIGIKVANGKVINNDSIYFEIMFEDDATPYGVTHVLAGHRSTSYEEYMNH
ncbi:lipid-binding protein [Parabacteroides sp. FAFU027]|uniref:lipid-binding protein n=1 Tax=Parabacteroides sp. FAFU027 TaxID=2922715 RepID=UPI001FB04ACB|nr:lipid-binding protein [Parabacteroides sp. FAFU027]